MILVLPFMQMPSGHHQVADAIEAHIHAQDPDKVVEKIDIFHYALPRIEKMISTIYLAWIQKYPLSYSKFYAKQFNAKHYDFKLFTLWENIMAQTLERLILEKKPEAVICTHSFPSHAVARLKKRGRINVPLINAYTDFFASGVWAKEYVDLHLVPSKTVRDHLVNEFHISAKRVLISGIPVHPAIQRTPLRAVPSTPHLLIAGGNSGLGNIACITKQLSACPHSRITVLCGNNRTLYQEIEALGLPHVRALPYIKSRTEMNALYDTVDAIITKPGGVTVSEALLKHIPIFISATLPGQEQVNMEYLLKHELVYELNDHVAPIEQVISMIRHPDVIRRFHQAVKRYETDIELTMPRFIQQALHILPKENAMPFDKVALFSL